MKNVIDLIRDFNPSYDPIEKARIEAGIDAERLDAALDRIYMDGMHGPISPREWEESDGRKPYYVSEAIEIVQKVADNIDDYWDEDDGEYGFDFNMRVDSREIAKAQWPFLVKIYGDLPF